MTINEIKAGYVIKHTKAINYISEQVDQANIGVMQSSTGATKIAMIFSRDIIEISHETLVEVPSVPGGLQPQVQHDALSTSRVQYANLTMTIEAAESLILGLRQTLDGLKAQSPES
ncbi:hypothetical protein [Pseudomonas sp. 2(2015)]|uniref:hypothetical protein n=1 Tax=Pseudomonas sp. 2(2015) TaxID=1619950 RepID=UPI0005EB56FE|nr:hypothetical protein [Pseudomonas sp. 2(2015)]KJK19080.1 hypothetical protein UB48_04780 [Pseudomonas sp. 2(2015)]